VQGSCGCTATDYSKEPIAPGKKGYVTATYNAANMGAFHKTVTVTANTDAPVVLVIKGEVKTETPSEEKTK
jgi:pectate lyase